MGRAPAAAVIALAFVLTVAGCGEKETPQATSDWAESLCTSLNSWTVDMEDIIREWVTPKDSEAAGGVIPALDRAETSTSTLRDDR